MTAVLVIVVLALVAAWLLKRKPAAPKSPATCYSAEAQRLASDIKTKADVVRLQREIAKLESKNYQSEAAENKAARKLGLLQEVEGIATSKPLAWQLVPAERIDVPLNVLEHAYKTFCADAAERGLAFLGDQKTSWWIPMDFYDEPEEAPGWLEGLKELRRVVESDMEVCSKVTAINAIYKKRQTLSEIFPVSEPLSAGLEWAARELSEAGVPKARELVQEGVLSEADVLAIDPEAFSKRKGVGPKTLAALQAYQEKMRERVQSPSGGASGGIGVGQI